MATGGGAALEVLSKLSVSTTNDHDAPAVITLETCASEPIHIPGAIQPHGALLACRDAQLHVARVSANIEAWLGAPPAGLLGRSLLEFVDAASAARLQAAWRAERLRELSPMRLFGRGGDAFDAVLHRPEPGLLVVELERAEAPAGGGYLGFAERLRTSILRLQDASDLSGLCRVAAEEVREITGFDRVMVYRFDADWNGEVVSESKRPDLEPFLGLHYPAADIPAQARRLYTVNWLRFIADVAYQQVPIVPALDPTTRAPLDLSHAALRSVSPVHLEYLRNMGVTASMSVSLVIDGTLAGLIACHHYSGPRLIPYRTRDTAEFLGQALSWQLRVLEVAHQAERARATSVCEAEVVRAAVTNSDLLDGLSTPAMVRLTAAAGVAVVLQDGIRRVGDCPPHRTLSRLVDWLAERGADIFVSDNLNAEVPVVDDERFAGLLAVALSPPLREYLLWFRSPTERTVDWAGDPRKAVRIDDSEVPARLSPRGSFALWRETVRGRAAPWQRWEIEAASSLRKSLLGGVRVRVAQLREVNQRLLDADRAKDDFISTVSHELRTPLNAILGWTHLLQSGGAHEKVQHGLAVIERNARAQAQIVDDLLDVSRMVGGKLSLDVDSVDLVALVTSVLDSFEVAATAKQLRLKRILDPSAASVLGDGSRLRQVVSNLVGNAIKFTPRGGSITFVLRRAESDVEMTVTDTGEGIAEELLPLVFDLFRQGDAGMNRRSRGLGIGLAIARKLTEMHGGRITAESPGVGLGASFRVRIPMAPVLPRELVVAAPVASPAGVLVGMRVLVVEDEADARELVVQLLAGSGAEVTEASDAAMALAQLERRCFDVMVSDVGMPGQDGFQLIREIRSRGGEPRLPAIALTAYSRAYDRTGALQAGFDAHVPKPVDAAELITVIASVVGRLGR